MSEAGDPRVRKVFDAAGFQYETDAQGEFKLIFAAPGARSQDVHVASRTERVGGVEIREVWSPAALFSGEVPLRLARHLLEANALVKVGAWAAVCNEAQQTLVTFRAHADAEGETLLAMMQYVTHRADELEKKLSDEDLF